MIKRMIIMLLAVGVLFGGIFGWKTYQAQQRQAGAGGRPPVTVSATTVEASRWQPTLAAVGSVRAVNGIEVAPEVEGVVSELGFSSGDRVEQGQALVTLIDDAERAQLRDLEAQAELARIELERLERLVADRAASESDLDSAQARHRQALARIDEQQALIAKKTIRAPFAGRLGIRQVDLGEYVSPGTAMVTLQQIQPIYVDFSLPQKHLAKASTGQTVHVRVDTFPGRRFTGEITAIDAQIATGTRNFSLQATLGNEDGALRPGMFADVAVVLAAERGVITLPQAAISHQPYGDSVFVVRGGDGETLTVARRRVQTGATRGDQIAVTEGLTAGERVVTSGHHKLRDGAPVQIDNAVTPSNEPDPTPAEQ